MENMSRDRSVEVRRRREADDLAFQRALGKQPGELSDAPGNSSFADSVYDTAQDVGEGLSDVGEIASKAGSQAYRSIADLMSGSSAPEGWHAPMSRPESSPVAVSHAKPLMQPGYNPQIEGKIQDEAKGLMMDEQARGSPSPAAPSPMGNSWHPPMNNPGVAGWHAPMASQDMPNTPRDPAAEKKQAEMMKQFLQGGGGPGYGLKKNPMASIPDSQNPFSKPTASPDDMAQASGEMMKSQVPQQPMPADTAQSKAMGTPQGLPELDEQDFGTDQDLSDDPTAGMEMDNANQPDAESEAHRRLMEMATAAPGQGSADDSRMAMDRAQFDTSNQNRDLGFMQLLMRNANQMGTIGGVAASSKPFDEYASDQQKQNNDQMSLMAKAQAGKKSESDDRAKMLQFLVGKEQENKIAQMRDRTQNRSNDAMNQYHSDLVGATAGNSADKTRLTDAQIEKLKAETEAKKNPAAKPGNAMEAYKLDQAKKGLDMYGNKVSTPEGKKMKNVGQESLDRKAAGSYGAYVTDGGRSSILTNIDRLQGVIDALDKDKDATGPIKGYVPDALLTFAGNKSPTYENDIRTAIQGSFKDTFGSQFTEKEGERLMATGYDKHQTPQENKRRIKVMVDAMRNKLRLTDASMQYFQDNKASMDGYQGDFQSQPKTPGNAATSDKVKVLYKGQEMMIPRTRLNEAIKDGAKESQ